MASGSREGLVGEFPRLGLLLLSVPQELCQHCKPTTLTDPEMTGVSVWWGPCPRLQIAPVLAYPDPQQLFIMKHWLQQCGFCCSDVPGRGEHVINCFSFSLRLLFQPWLWSWVSATGHASLTWLLNFEELEGQLAWWLETLQDCNFEIRHGLHTNADAQCCLLCSS